jgi:hypothetical protein
MTEVAGGAARLIPRMPLGAAERKEWAKMAAGVLDEVLQLKADERAKLLKRAELNATRFAAGTALAAYEKVYAMALKA